MSNKKSGTTPHERMNFMREHGYTETKGGSGSHIIWIHTSLRELARQQSIEMPANLRSNVAQKAWEISLPDNPGTGLWQRIERQAEWCQKTVEEALHAAQRKEAEKRVREEFRAQRNEILSWRKEVKHCYKRGVKPPHSPLDARLP